MIYLHHCAVVAETDTQWEMRFHSNGKILLHQAVAVGLGTKIYEHLDRTTTAAAAIRFQMNPWGRYHHVKDKSQ
jgi:hypothetical protein